MESADYQMNTKPRSRTKTIVRWVNYDPLRDRIGDGLLYKSKPPAFVFSALSEKTCRVLIEVPITLPAPKKRRGL